MGLEHDPEDCMIKMRAKEVMATKLVSFREVESVGEIHKVLYHCTHNAFPVLRDGRVVGVVSRDQLHFLLNHGEKHDIFSADGKIVPWIEMGASLAQSREGLKETLSEELSMKSLDLRPYLSKDYHTMSENACLFSCYNVFRQMGLRHLFVVNESDGKWCGVITRKNLILMEPEDIEDMGLRGRRARRLSDGDDIPIGTMPQGFGGIAGL